MSEWDVDEALRRAAAVQQVPDAPGWRRTGSRAVALAYSMTGQMGAAREAMRGAVTEAERAEAGGDTVCAWVDLSTAEMLVGSGDPTPPLRELLDRSTLERACATRRSGSANAAGRPARTSYGPHRLAAPEALGRLYEQNGQLEEARVHYTTYVQQLVDGASLPWVAAVRERLRVLQQAERLAR